MNKKYRLHGCKAAVVIHTNSHHAPQRRNPSAVLFFKKVRPALRVLISLEKFKKDFMKDGGFFKGIQVQ
ncbi:hypothetical protein [Gallintestinimicrobium sp.]|uniref:hypothetical protein n=1 Tax=Gallintestinimicrobium sp. TaxID=2981655 RepID=UPI003992DA2C